jgi:hypothetical protein
MTVAAALVVVAIGGEKAFCGCGEAGGRSVGTWDPGSCGRVGTDRKGGGTGAGRPALLPLIRVELQQQESNVL